MPRAIWDELLRGSPITTLAAGEPVYMPDGPPRMAAILDGLLRIFAWAAGERPSTVLYLRPGQVVGLARALSRTEITGAAEAVVATRLALVPVERVRSVAMRHPELSWAIAEEVAGMAATAVSVLIHGFEPIRVRLARELLDLTGDARGQQLTVAVTHQRLADSIGTSREVITRVLGELREQGLLDTRTGKVLILDRSELVRIASPQPPL